MPNSDTPPTPAITDTLPRSRFYRLWLAAAVIVVAVAFFLPTLTPLEKAHAVGYGICHQLPARTFVINGQPLPLCARFTGIYLGAIAGLGVMLALGRARSTQFPPPILLAPFIGFTLIMGVDGVNSYLTFFPNAPHLYEPQNWLRLITGTLHGLTMSVIILPLVNESLWHPTAMRREPVVKSGKELALLLAAAALVIAIVLWRPPILMYPMIFLSSLGVLLMLTLIDAVFVALLTRQLNVARTWRGVWPTLVIGLSVAIGMLAGMYLLRAWLAAVTGAPI